mgnify:CR=1 FL=1|jgi:hypothetical protein
MFNTPVLLIIFNSPDTTQKVLDRLREIKPRFLYVTADGARSNVKADIKLCLEARAIVEQIDWECELHTNFHDSNQGLKTAISSGITWFFDSVEQGIILEDDCVPNKSFFRFCEELLEKYKNDQRVMSISGNNFQDGNVGEGSYYFSRLTKIWGWATWRRSWLLLDLNLKQYSSFKSSNQIENIFNDSFTKKFWMAKMEAENKGGNSWAFPWAFTHFLNNGLCITPNKNLVTNIGYREGATHATNEDSILANLQTEEIPYLHHPKYMIPQLEADRRWTRLAAKEQFTIRMRLETWIRSLIPNPVKIYLKSRFLK